MTLPRIRSPERDKAFELYKDSGGTLELVRIAGELEVPEGTVRGWKNKDKWEEKINGTFQKKNTERSKKPRGAPKGNKNAKGNKGGAAPKGNINAIKHGAYQTIYAAFLPEDEKEVYDQMPGEAELEAEIRLLRLKITRLLNREETFFYDMFGGRHDKELSEEDRDAGIIACTKQLEKLVKTQSIVQRRALDEEEQRVRIEKLRAETAKLTEDSGDDDGVIICGGDYIEE